MEDRNTQAATPFNFDDSNVAGWALPESAVARLGRGSLRDMAFSPDGQYFAVGTSIGLWLYELPALSPIALWETDRGYIDGVTFSPDSQWIAAHPREALTVWDIQRGICIAEMEFTKKRYRFGLSKPVFSQDGERLVVFHRHHYNAKVLVWCPRTGALLSETEIPSTHDVYPTCFSPDLNLLAGTCLDRSNQTAEFIAVWCVKTGEQIARFDWFEDLKGFCFSPSGRFLAAGSSVGKIHVWDIESGNFEETYIKDQDAHTHPYYPLEGGLIAAAASPSQSKIEIWHLEKDEEIDTFGPQSSSNFVRFSESGTQLAYIDSGEIRIWTKGRTAVQAFPTIQGPTLAVGSLVLAPDEKTLVATYWGRTTFLWNVSNQCVQNLTTVEELPNRIRNVYSTVSGKVLAIGRDEDILKVRELGNNNLIAEIPIPEIELLSKTGTEALTPIGHRLAAVGRDRNIYVWECTDIDMRGNWEKCAVLTGHSEPIGALAFNPDGKRLASISMARTALLWNVNTGEQIAEMDLPRPPSKGKRSGRYTDVGVTFSPLGDIIAGGHQGDIVLWDATDGKTLMTLRQPEESQRAIMLRFSPCGQYLASGAWWQSGLQKVPIRLWEVASGKNIVTFWGHTSDVQCFSFSQDGPLLISGGYDGVIYLWDMEPYL